jgi:hypothetical protein
MQSLSVHPSTHRRVWRGGAGGTVSHLHSPAPSVIAPLLITPALPPKLKALATMLACDAFRQSRPQKLFQASCSKGAPAKLGASPAATYSDHDGKHLESSLQGNSPAAARRRPDRHAPLPMPPAQCPPAGPAARRPPHRPPPPPPPGGPAAAPPASTPPPRAAAGRTAPPAAPPAAAPPARGFRC